MFKILICEQVLSFTAKELFPNYAIDIAYNEHDILNYTFEKDYDLFIVNYYFYDTMLELENYNKNTQIVFVDEYYDITHLKNAFVIGDDYMTKPLNLKELEIRINHKYKKLFSIKSTIISYRNFFFHKNTRQLFLKDKLIKLTPNELKLVEFFLLYIEKPLTKDMLYNVLNSYSDGTLRVYISRLKKVGFNIRYIRANSSYTLSK